MRGTLRTSANRTEGTTWADMEFVTDVTNGICVTIAGRTNERSYEQTRKDEGAEGADQGEVSTIILGMLESSGFRKYSTLLVIQLFSRRLCLCLCLSIRLCLCICVPYSFLNSY